MPWPSGLRRCRQEGLIDKGASATVHAVSVRHVPFSVLSSPYHTYFTYLGIVARGSQAEKKILTTTNWVEISERSCRPLGGFVRPGPTVSACAAIRIGTHRHRKTHAHTRPRTQISLVTIRSGNRRFYERGGGVRPRHRVRNLSRCIAVRSILTEKELFNYTADGSITASTNKMNNAGSPETVSAGHLKSGEAIATWCLR